MLVASSFPFWSVNHTIIYNLANHPFIFNEALCYSPL